MASTTVLQQQFSKHTFQIAENCFDFERLQKCNIA
jgi:hypothetical protein